MEKKRRPQEGCSGDEGEIFLSHKDRTRRDFVLTGSVYNVILTICGPIALYQSLNQIFRILDTMMAAHIDAISVSAVAYISQLQLMMASVGGGLAVGGGIKIAECYGAGLYGMVKKQVNSLMVLSMAMGAAVLVGILPFTEEILRVFKTPDLLIATGANYFKLEIIAMVLGFFNNIYIAVERARGNSKVILHLNILMILVKLGFTAFFVYVVSGTVTMIAVASLLSQVVVFAAGIYNLRDPKDVFGLDPRHMRMQREVVEPMLKVSFPVMVEKLAFGFGKVVVNAMATLYGTLTVGALGISNNIGGLTTNPQNGFQDGGAAIIAQNLGAKRYRRALETVYKLLVVNVLIGVAGYVLTIAFLPQISGLFARDDTAFQQLVSSVYRYEALGAVPLGVAATVMALLYGFGYTKLTLAINFSRVFLFRIPVLYYLQNHTDIGSRSVGIVMMVSNIAVGVLSLGVGLFVIREIMQKSREEKIA
ncbi:MATE family efflux transporter [Anaerotalea alkaliphila]|uniref:MATE family efflux transporter n=1 Tax=Anaerotalea alkaliphila TaxID=2662126 RepID=A0A7X5HUY9_9FIRM|nr:MATE family efflux transporter [Anaerotalea alkaliphila]NDL67090.1 MATE family efflux transporter [Anaerotalea alkaliphila]